MRQDVFKCLLKQSLYSPHKDTFIFKVLGERLGEFLCSAFISEIQWISTARSAAKLDADFVTLAPSREFTNTKLALLT